MADALDAAVSGTTVVPARDPRWWRTIGAAQWVLLGVTVLGGLWLGALAGAGYLRLPTPEPPRWGEVPWPTVALIAGVVLGLLLAGVAHLLAGVGARRQARLATARLREAVTGVAELLVVTPVDEVLAALVRTRQAAEAAAGGSRSRRSNS